MECKECAGTGTRVVAYQLHNICSYCKGTGIKDSKDETIDRLTRINAELLENLILADEYLRKKGYRNFARSEAISRANEKA